STSKSNSPISCNASIAKQIKSRLNSRGILCRSAIGISSQRVATSKAEKLELAKSGAEVVDMESYEIVAAANEAGLPAIVIRAVSASLDRQIPDLNSVLRADGEIDSLNFMKVAIGSPILTAKVLAASRRALGKLKGVLALVLSDEAYSKAPSEATPLSSSSLT